METAERDMFVQAAERLRLMSEKGANPFFRSTIMDPWTSEFVDVASIHARATREIEILINHVKEEGRSKSRLLVGDSANGKSHVLARTKKLFSKKAFFCFVEPLTGDGQNIFRHILKSVVSDLLRSIPGAAHLQFYRVWREFFMGVAKNHSDHHRNFLAWTENRKYDFICLVSNQLKAIGKHIDPRIVGVLYQYVRNYSNDSRVRLVIESWLATNLLNEEET